MTVTNTVYTFLYHSKLIIVINNLNKSLFLVKDFYFKVKISENEIRNFKHLRNRTIY